MVVEAQGVVTDAGEVGGEAVGRLRGGRVVGVAADVDAVEALRHPGEILELEMVADGDDAAELSRRRVVLQHLSEVERGARLDPRLVRKRNPIGTGRDGCSPAVGEFHDRWGLCPRTPIGARLRPRTPELDCSVDCVFTVGFKRAFGEEDADCKAVAAPVRPVLQEYARGVVEGHAERNRSIGLDEDQVRHCTSEEMRLGAVERDWNVLAIDDGLAAGYDRAVEAAADEGLKQIGLYGSRCAPAGGNCVAAKCLKLGLAFDRGNGIVIGKAYAERAPAVGIGVKAAIGAFERPAWKGRSRRQRGDGR